MEPTREAARRHAAATVARSKTSFGAGMRILSPERRAAMYAIYAFCREVDDIADEGGTCQEKLRDLGEWRREIERVYGGAPTTQTGLALVEAVRAFELPRDEFMLVIEGMEMDAAGPIIAPSLDGFYAYTRRAAGAVGMLSMPVFGAPEGQAADEFALSLGDALQITNILRDIEQDADEGRLYVPHEILTRHDCPLTPDAIASADGLPAARADLAAMARQKFAAVRCALSTLDWRPLRPALLMMGVYEHYLYKMTARGWANGQPRITLSKGEKAAIAARWFFAPKIKSG